MTAIEIIQQEIAHKSEFMRLCEKNIDPENAEYWRAWVHGAKFALDVFQKGGQEMKNERKAKAMFEPDIWFQAWKVAVRSGHNPHEAADYADVCLRGIKERYGKKEETK